MATPTDTSSSANPSSNPSSNPTAAILLIGNEILSGRTQDLNLAYMASRLADHGIRVTQARVIPDIEDVVVNTLNELRANNTYVFTTGGIGPTHDDITADCIAKAFGVPIDINPEAEKILMEYWAGRNVTPNSDRLRMARIPDGASLIDNPVSAAPGFCMGNVFVMAGVPRIMQAMFDSILPTLQQGDVIASVSVRCNLGEGDLATPLRNLQAQYPAVDLGSYPGKHAGAYAVTLVARSTDTNLLNEVQQALITLVDNAGGQLINE